MPGMLKYERNAVTASSLTACVLLIALWVRSYSTRDSVFWPCTNHAMQVSSLKGHVVIWIVGKLPSQQWVPFKIEHVTIGESFKSLFDNDVLGFYFERQPDGLRLDMPHWFLVLAVMIIAAGAWLHEKWRFSLRTLLIATTLVAVALGIVVAAR